MNKITKALIAVAAAIVFYAIDPLAGLVAGIVIILYLLFME